MPRLTEKELLAPYEADPEKGAQAKAIIEELKRIKSAVEDGALAALTERVQMLEEELLARAPMTIALHGRVDALEAKANDGQRVIELIKAEFSRQGFNS